MFLNLKGQKNYSANLFMLCVSNCYTNSLFSQTIPRFSTQDNFWNNGSSLQFRKRARKFKHRSNNFKSHNCAKIQTILLHKSKYFQKWLNKIVYYVCQHLLKTVFYVFQTIPRFSTPDNFWNNGSSLQHGSRCRRMRHHDGIQSFWTRRLGFTHRKMHITASRGHFSKVKWKKF